MDAMKAEGRDFTGILFVVDFKVPKLKGKGIIALGVLVVIELVQILCFS